MIGDQDVVYVDFDDLFENEQLFSTIPSSSNPQQQQGYSNPTDFQRMISGEQQRLYSDSGVVTTSLIDSFVANQPPLAPPKKPRKKKKDQSVRYIRQPTPPIITNNDSNPEEAIPTPTSSSSAIKKSPSTANMTTDENPSDIPTADKPVMTREQFYRIRPKMPKIAKTDPRRLYASYFAKAYNSCDIQQIWQFLSTYCVPDVLFIQRWVGAENYLNFPKYIEIRGIEKSSEYWFSRCVISPDMILQLKETKLYVRSDGLSTVLSSFTIDVTRLYDSEVSHAIVVQSFLQEGKKQKVNSNSSSNSTSSGNNGSNAPQVKQEGGRAAVKDEKVTNPVVSSKELLQIPQSILSNRQPILINADSNDHRSKKKDNNSNSNNSQIPVEPPPQIGNRVFEKMKTILLAHMAQEKKELLARASEDSEGTSYEGLRKKIEEEKLALDKQQEKIRLMEDEHQFHLQFMTSDEEEGDEEDEEEQNQKGEGSKGKKPKKRKLQLPKDRSITFLGTLTMHLNQEMKVQQMEITFALRK